MLTAQHSPVFRDEIVFPLERVLLGVPLEAEPGQGAVAHRTHVLQPFEVLRCAHQVERVVQFLRAEGVERLREGCDFF